MTPRAYWLPAPRVAALAAALTILALSNLPTCASAQVRTLPEDAPVGRLTIGTLTEATIDDQRFRLAPGARIFSAANKTLVPGMVPPDVTVRYRLDREGQIMTVWILDEAEQAAAVR